MNNLKQVKKALIDWNKLTFGNILQKVIDAEDLVLRKEMAFEEDPSPENRIEVNKAEAELNYRNKIEDQFLAQKANLKWLLEGDTNSKFFHNIVKKRRIKSKITSVINEQGEVLTRKEDTEDTAVEFFKGLLDNQSPTFENFKSLKVIPRLLDEEPISMLDDYSNLEEIKSVVWELKKDSSPGIDGFNGHFFTSCWDIIKEDLLKAINKSYVGSEIPKTVSTTLITLIPKKVNAKSFSDYRPISLCTFCNKFVHFLKV